MRNGITNNVVGNQINNKMKANRVQEIYKNIEILKKELENLPKQ